MKKTGVFASAEETAEIQEIARQASTTPVISFGGPSFAETAWRRAQERCHALALEHGLPEIQGFYGATQEGEFVEV